MYLVNYLLADPPSIARERKKKSLMKPTLHFLCVPADLKVYYQYNLVDKKGGWGLMRLWK